jgi:hypothetical protein
MTPTDFEIFAKVMRSEALRRPYRSERYKEFVTKKEKDPHHIYGSVHGLKSTDLAIIPVTRLEHVGIQNKPVTQSQIREAIRWNWEYIKHLEEIIDAQ